MYGWKDAIASMSPLSRRDHQLRRLEVEDLDRVPIHAELRRQSRPHLDRRVALGLAHLDAVQRLRVGDIGELAAQHERLRARRCRLAARCRRRHALPAEDQQGGHAAAAHADVAAGQHVRELTGGRHEVAFDGQALVLEVAAHLGQARHRHELRVARAVDVDLVGLELEGRDGGARKRGCGQEFPLHPRVPEEIRGE
jgi:hypothetical protein